MPHPFNFVYPVQCSKDAAAIQELYDWTVSEYGVHTPAPPVLVVNHEHMQRAASRSSTTVDARKHVFGWYTRGCRTVYVSDRLKPSKRRSCAAIIIHEFVHYLQDVANVEGPVVMLETEADSVMMKYVSLTR